MATELEVQLSANIKDLQSQLKKAESALDNFGDNAAKQTNKTAKSFDGLKKSTVNAIPATQEFSRVIQDAPYGIQGVGNNIQQLTSQFGYLSKATGGAIPALKAMVSSLAGPAGILLAVSVVTSALTYYANNGLGKTKSATEELAEAQEKLSKELEDYRSTLVGVTKARVEGNRSAAEELTQLRLLRNQIEDTNLSQELREDGIKQLQKAFPSYFKDVKQEALLNGSLKTTYDKLTESIVNRAKATAASDLLIENAKKEIILTQQLDELNAKIATNDADRGKARDNFNKSTQQSYLFGINPAAQAYGKEISNNNNLLEDQASIQEKLADIAKENEKLSSFVQANVTIDPNLNIDKDKLEDKFKNTFKNLGDVFAIKSNVQKTLDGFTPDFSNFKVQFNKLGDIIGFAIKDSASKAVPQLTEIEKALLNFNENASQIINDNIVNTFAGFGEAIGDALINGGNLFQSLGKVLLGGIGSILTQLGEMAIATGIGLQAIQASLTSLNPGIAIAAGIALVALGSAFSAGAANLGKTGSSGYSSGSSNTVAGQGTSASVSNGGSNFGASGSSGGTVVFEIQGQKLVGVLNRTLGANARLGGNLSLG